MKKNAFSPIFIFTYFLIVCTCLIFLFIAYGNWLISGSVAEKADVICVLSGSDDTRMKKTAQLYHEGYAENIILTNIHQTYGEYNFPYSYLQKEILKEFDVPESAMFITNFVAENSGQEATAIIWQMFEIGASSALIVTDSWHTRRVKIIFSDSFANTGFQISIISAKSDFSPSLWWLSGSGWQKVIGETIRIVGYWVKRSTNIPDYPQIFK